MAFINQAVTVLQTLVIALGAGLAVWGVVNLMEGYGNDNPGAKSQGMQYRSKKLSPSISLRVQKICASSCRRMCFNSAG